MNFDPQLSTGGAIAVALTAALFWGSWAIILKYLDDSPLDAFYIILFTSSALFVWIVGFILDGVALLSNIAEVWRQDASRVILPFLAGATYVGATMLGMRVMQRVGLALAQPISSSIGLILGTLFSYLVGGVPENMSVGRILLAGAFLVAAIFLTNLSGNVRAQKLPEQLGRERITGRILLMVVLSSFSGVIYSLGISYGLKSVTQPVGLAVMPFICVLLTGAWLSSSLISGIQLSRRRGWGEFKRFRPRLYLMIFAAAAVHYAGNILHAYAARSLSTVMAWPLSMTASLWNQVWGLAYGEFKHAPRRAYLLLGTGVLCYLIGAFIISNLF